MKTEPSSISASVKRRGFTLTEVLVASAIGVILLGVVLSVMGVGTDGYSRTMARVDANVEARTALRTLADDVASARVDESFGLRRAEADRGLGEIWFSAFKPRSAQNAEKASGDLCFAYYYTAVTGPLESGRGPYSRKLYRRLVSSADVMSKLKAGESLDDPAPTPVSPEDEAIAFNVVQFLAEPLVRGEDGSELQWTEEGDDPTHLQVTLQVTDNETAGALTDQEDWEGGSTLSEQLLAPNSSTGAPNKRVRSFRMTIPFTR